MLIPISHERDTLLRWPIVTLTVIVVCLAVHLWAWPPEDETPLAQDALVYYLEHPYLDPGDELLSGLPSQLFERFQLESELTPGRRPPPSKLRAEQRKLDEKIASWLAVRDRQPIQQWGLVPARYTAVEVVTHQFLHVGWIHLLSNLFILYLAAPPVEDLWGRPLFALFYVAAGAAAGLAFVAKYPLTEVPLVGASGAIAGVMGVFLVRFWNIKIKFFYFLWMIKFYTGTFRAPAWLMLPLWFGNEVFSAYVADVSSVSTAQGAGGGVAYLAHIGGFVFGVGIALLAKTLGLDERMKEKIYGKIGLEERPVLEAAAEARRIGAPDEAIEMLAAELRASPSDRELLGAIWDAAVDAKRAPELAPRVQHLIEIEIREGEEDLAIQHWDEFLAHAPEAPVSPRVAAAVAERLVADRDPAGVRLAIQRALAGAAVLAPMTARRLARAAAEVDGDLAAEVARRALAQRDLDPEIHAELSAMAAAESPVGEPTLPEPPVKRPPAERSPVKRSPVERHPVERESPGGRAAPTRPPASPSEGEDSAAASESVADPWQRPTRPNPAPRLSPTVDLKRIAATPREIQREALALTTGDGKAVVLRLEKIRAVGVAEIRTGDELPYFLVDLILDPPGSGAAIFRVVRLDTRKFDPHRLVPGEEAVPRALVTIVGRLLAATGGDLYPKELDPFSPQPFSSFPSIEFYERELGRQLQPEEEG